MPKRTLLRGVRGLCTNIALGPSAASSQAARPRLGAELLTKLGAFQAKFDELLKLQADATQMEHPPSQPETEILGQEPLSYTRRCIHM